MKCPNCETENPENSRYCQQCGTALETEAAENSHSLAYFVGVVGLLVFLPLAVISGIYLWTRPEPNVKRNGRNIIVIALVLFIVFLIINLAINAYI